MHTSAHAEAGRRGRVTPTHQPAALARPVASMLSAAAWHWCSTCGQTWGLCARSTLQAEAPTWWTIELSAPQQRRSAPWRAASRCRVRPTTRRGALAAGPPTTGAHSMRSASSQRSRHVVASPHTTPTMHARTDTARQSRANRQRASGHLWSKGNGEASPRSARLTLRFELRSGPNVQSLLCARVLRTVTIKSSDSADTTHTCYRNAPLINQSGSTSFDRFRTVAQPVLQAPHSSCVCR